MRLAIVADDLTGALDVSAPFAARGLRVIVATNPAGTGRAIAGGADIVCINTASREMNADAARDTVASVARQLAEASPEIAFKKIDSRLKGHVAVEVQAAMQAFGRGRVIVAPAVPTQQRHVIDGHVVGTGVPTPLSIAAAIGGAFPYEAPDTRDAADLAVLARCDWGKTLLVGASGLGASLAQLLSGHSKAPVVALSGPLLIAVGSHDPITLAQVKLALAGTGLTHVVSRDGGIDIEPTGPALIQAVVPANDLSHGTAMARFGASVAALLCAAGHPTVLLTGGETAQTVLEHLGIDCLEVLGEILPGIPITQAELGDRALTILTKSGGFGTPEDILLLARIAEGTTPATEHQFAGD